MILSEAELRAEVAKGTIAFSPELEDAQWGKASIDLRLGFQFTKLQMIDGLSISVAKGLGAVAGARLWKTQTLREHDSLGKREQFALCPGEFVLAQTYEKITVPNHLIALIEGRSTYARVGLSMHQTAPWIQPGWSGPIVLEIMNHGPLEIQLTPLIDRPCQIAFFQLTSAIPDERAYGAGERDRYQEQKHPITGAGETK